MNLSLRHEKYDCEENQFKIQMQEEINARDNAAKEI